MKFRFAVGILALGFSAYLLPLFAHHSVEAQYDISKTVTIRGLVTKTEWTNPHTRFWVDAKNDDGTVANWEMELLPPNTLKRQGVKQDFVKPGDAVAVEVWTAKDGSKFGHTLTLTLADGQVMQFPRGLGWKLR